MLPPLATSDDLAKRLGRTLTGTDLDMANAALADASARVRAYGFPWPDPATAPDIAVAITLDAAERKMRNPDGISQELEGSYQYLKPTSNAVGTELSAQEVRILQYASGKNGLFSVPVESLGGTL